MLGNRIEHILEMFSQNVFGHGVTPALREFMGHISYSFVGGIISAGILLGTNILAGRLLGAQEYGKYNLIFACSQILIVLLVFGMDLSVARSLATRSEHRKKSQDISTASSVVLLSIFCFLILVLLFRNRIASVFHFSSSLLVVAALFGSVLALRQFFDSVMRGMALFKIQSLARVGESLIIISLFGIAVYAVHETSVLAYIVPVMIGGVLLCVIYAAILRTHMQRFDRTTLWELTGYGKIAFLASLLGIAFGSLDKIAIAKYLSLYDVGVYGAYYTASFVIVSQIGALFDNVFFPTVSRFRDNLTPIIQKVDRLSLYFCIPFFLGMCAVIYILLQLFGKGYPVVWSYIAGFSLIATLKMILIANTSLITAHSKQSLTLGLVYGNTINVLFIGLFVVFITFFELSITSMIWFLVLYTGVFVALNKWILYKVGFYRRFYVAS